MHPAIHCRYYGTNLAPFVMRLLFFALGLTILLPAHPARAQSGRTYTTADGLPSNNIQALAYQEDPLDFPPCNPPECTDPPVIPGLWVGTDKGLTLNGREAVTIDTARDMLPSPDVRALLFDRDGLLWVATASGLARINYGDKPWEGRTIDWRSDHYLLGRELLALAQTGDGQLWVGTYAGLVKFDPDTGRDEVIASSGSLRVTALPWCPFAIEGGCGDRALWMGTNAELYRFEWQGDKELVPVEDFPEALAEGSVQALTYDESGLWVGTTKGAAHWNGEEWDIIFAEKPRRLPHVNVRRIDIDDKGRVWFGTEEGVAYFTPKANTWRHFNRSRDTVKEIQTQSLLIDLQSATWVGNAAGLHGLDNRWILLDQLSTYDYTGLADNEVFALSHDPQSRTWVGTNGGGVTVFDETLIPIETFSTDNSLAANQVRSIFHDTQGRTWVGTYGGGVTIFDESLTPITTFTADNSLAANQVQALSHDTQGRTWVGTYGGGVTIFDESLALIATFTADNGLADNQVRSLSHDPQGRTWVGTVRGGVTIFDEALTSIVTFNTDNGLADNNVRVLSHDPQGRTWVGTGGFGTVGGVTVFDEALTPIATFNTDNGLADNFVNALSHDPQGRTWVGTGGFGTVGGVTVFDEALTPIATFNTDNGFDGNDVQVLSHDPQGHTWVGTGDFSGGGVTVFDEELNPIATFSINNGLASHIVNALSHDPQGRTWVGTYGGGITIFDEEFTPIATFSTNNSLAGNEVSAISRDLQDRTWIATGDFSGGGVTVFDEEFTPIATFSTDNSLAANEVSAISHDPQGRTWVGTYGGGVTIFDEALTSIATFSADNGLADNVVNALSHDPQGRIWIGTDDFNGNGGVTVFDEELTPIATFNSDNGLAADDVRALSHDPQGRTWVGTVRGGVTILDEALSPIATFSTANGLAADDVRALSHDPQGRTWVGTGGFGTGGGGVTVFDEELTPIATFNSDNGLAANNVQALSHDPQGRTWVGTSDIRGNGKGVTVFDEELIPIATFNSDNGLAANNVQALSHDPQGRTWVGTDGGVTVFDNSANDSWLDITMALQKHGNEWRLFDSTAVDLFFSGRSLLTQAPDLRYHIQLSDLTTGQPVYARTLTAGNTDGRVQFGDQQRLSYHRYQLDVAISDILSTQRLLPPLVFDVQARPTLSVSVVFTEDIETVTVHWLVQDPDHEDKPLQLNYRWFDPSSGVNILSQSEVITISQSGTMTSVIWSPRATIHRGDPDLRAGLTLFVTDADGNPSVTVEMVRIFAAPLSYRQLLLPFGVGLGTLFLVVVAGLGALSQTSGLPIGLLTRQGIIHWIPVGLGYRAYQQGWQILTPLEGLLVLIIPPTQPLSQKAIQARLNQQQIPVPPERLTRALETLERERWLTRTEAGYSTVNPPLLHALQMHKRPTHSDTLAIRVRFEHPLVATATQFFAAASFLGSTTMTDLLVITLQPLLPIWESWFTKPVYTRLFPNRPLDQEAANELYRAAQQVPDRADVLFALIDQTPTDSGWIAIGALRADGIQVIPIDDAFMQQARSQQRERQELQAHLRRFLGRQRDLYNVRDPVADRLNFFGREATAQDLLETLNEGRPLALFGLRKMGKSSLLQVLGDRVAFPVAHVDLQAGVELSGLYGRILAGWQRTLPLKHPSVTWTPPTLTGDPAAAFTAAVNGLLAQLAQAGVDPRLGIFVDEIDLLMPTNLPPPRPEGSRPQPGGGTVVSSTSEQLPPQPGEGWGGVDRYLTFTRTLRGLVQETNQLSLLVAGVDARLNHRNRWGDQQNPFYQFFQEHYLGPLVESDCIQMVRNIGRQMGLVYGEGAAEAVAVVSGGHPFLARQVCSMVLRLRGENAGSEITLAEIEAAADQFVRDPGTAANLDEGGMWGEVTNPALWPQPQVIENTAILTTLAETERQPEAELLNSAQDRQARERSLTELEQRAVLGRLEQLLRIQFGLFQTWIRRYRL